jgi:hypothetical protein
MVVFPWFHDAIMYGAKSPVAPTPIAVAEYSTVSCATAVAQNNEAIIVNILLL